MTETYLNGVFNHLNAHIQSDFKGIERFAHSKQIGSFNNKMGDKFHHKRFNPMQRRGTQKDKAIITETQPRFIVKITNLHWNVCYSRLNSRSVRKSWKNYLEENFFKVKNGCRKSRIFKLFFEIRHIRKI